MSDIQDIALQAMRPGCFYRAVDLAVEAGIKPGQARYALRRLSRGGVAHSERRKGDRVKVFITKQYSLYFAGD